MENTEKELDNLDELLGLVKDEWETADDFALRVRDYIDDMTTEQLFKLLSKEGMSSDIIVKALEPILNILPDSPGIETIPEALAIALKTPDWERLAADGIVTDAEFKQLMESADLHVLSEHERLWRGLITTVANIYAKDAFPNLSEAVSMQMLSLKEQGLEATPADYLVATLGVLGGAAADVFPDVLKHLAPAVIQELTGYDIKSIDDVAHWLSDVVLSYMTTGFDVDVKNGPLAMELAMTIISAWLGPEKWAEFVKAITMAAPVVDGVMKGGFSVLNLLSLIDASFRYKVGKLGEFPVNQGTAAGMIRSILRSERALDGDWVVVEMGGIVMWFSKTANNKMHTAFMMTSRKTSHPVLNTVVNLIGGPLGRIVTYGVKLFDAKEANSAMLSRLAREDSQINRVLSEHNIQLPNTTIREYLNEIAEHLISMWESLYVSGPKDFDVRSDDATAADVQPEVVLNRPSKSGEIDISPLSSGLEGEVTVERLGQRFPAMRITVEG